MRFSPADFPLPRFLERRNPIISFSASLQLELDELRDEMNAFSGTLKCWRSSVLFRDELLSNKEPCDPSNELWFRRFSDVCTLPRWNEIWSSVKFSGVNERCLRLSVCGWLYKCVRARWVLFGGSSSSSSASSFDKSVLHVIKWNGMTRLLVWIQVDDLNARSNEQSLCDCFHLKMYTDFISTNANFLFTQNHKIRNLYIGI